MKAGENDIAYPASRPTEVSPPVGLTIAGFDPSSGAGITADLKVFEAHRVYGVAAITALTVQSTLGVMRTEAVSSSLLRDTLDCLVDDLCITGVKIGMLATADNVLTVASWLADLAESTSKALDANCIVLDPVLISTSGAALIDAEGVDAIGSELLSRVGWLTPNWSELARLSGLEISRIEDLPAAALGLQAKAKARGNSSLNVIVTGGDQSADIASDLAPRSSNRGIQVDPLQDQQAAGRSSVDFLIAAGEQFLLTGPRVNTRSTHGTGCAFSSALMCELMAGKSPYDACLAAKRYVFRALQAAYPMGQGRGPINPFV